MTSQKLVIVYGAYINADADWKTLIRLQLDDLRETGVLSHAHLHVIASNPAGIEGVAEFFETIGVSIRYIEIHDTNRFEYPALLHIWNLANKINCEYVAYLHTKGISYAKDQRVDIEKTLTHLTFSGWRKVLRIFDTHRHVNKIGVFPARHDGLPSAWVWFNFWWARSSLIRSLPKPQVSTDRWFHEVWLGLSQTNTRTRDWYSVLTEDDSLFSAHETSFNLAWQQEYGTRYKAHRRWRRIKKEQYREPVHVHKCHLVPFIKQSLRKKTMMTLPRALRGDGVEQLVPFSSLTKEPSDILTRDKFELINRIIIAGTTPIETIAESAWRAHAPIMFCLFELLRPRRYVELGSHNGYSFFAACQGAKIAETSTQCIAIDSWEGDEHAGFYGPETYDVVRHYLTHKYSSQFTLRAYFSDALSSFEDGSIDLLHIDGLHTYQAVKTDFESWLPKMSERGVILFHDTNVYERDFGVYIFWRKVAERYPSYELRHESGLGILFVGKDEAIKSVFSMFSKNREYGVAIQNLILRVSDLSVALMAATLGQAQSESPAKAAIEPEAKTSIEAEVDHAADISTRTYIELSADTNAEMVSYIDRTYINSQIRKYWFKWLLTYPFNRPRRRYRKKILALRDQLEKSLEIK